LINSYIADRDIIVNRGIKVYGNALINKMAAMDLGIPEEDVVILEDNFRNT